MSELLTKLKDSALSVDCSGIWPGTQLDWLRESTVLRSVIPESYGGLEIDAGALTQEYHDLAAACMTTCFILTQRNGACQRIAGAADDDLKAEFLPRLATGEIFGTVGISHLTTSRQHIAKPAVQVTLGNSDMILQGEIPWVTGAAAADVIVTGGTCQDGRQILIAMPTDLRGITMNSPAQLMALTASETASVSLEKVSVPKSHLIAGPVEAVMSQGTAGGAGSLTTSTLALGLCTRMMELINMQSSRRPDLVTSNDSFHREYVALAQDLFAASRGEGDDWPERSPASIRTRSNSLALRMTQAALTITKGAGFVKGHPVELAVREAMFFLVWSCPQPVAQNVLHELACRDFGI